MYITSVIQLIKAQKCIKLTRYIHVLLVKAKVVNDSSQNQIGQIYKKLCLKIKRRNHIKDCYKEIACRELFR